MNHRDGFQDALTDGYRQTVCTGNWQVRLLCFGRPLPLGLSQSGHGQEWSGP